VSRKRRNELKCTAVCLQLDILCGSVRGSAGSSVLNCMYCCELVVGHFVWECEGVRSEWRTELKCTAVCWQLDILYGSVRDSAGSGVLN